MFPNFVIYQIFGEDQTGFESVIIVEAKMPYFCFRLFPWVGDEPKLTLVNLSFQNSSGNNKVFA